MRTATRNAASLTLLPIGTKVLVGDSVEATVCEISISKHDRVQYRCAWWDGNTRHSDWLEQHEVTANKDASAMPIGFSHGRNGNS